MKKFKVRFTRTETYVYEREVEAKNKLAAISSVAEDEDWSYPETPAYADEESEAEEVTE